MRKVTILMSTYNGEKFLREQLESLLAQKLPEDCEMKILIRDDGSNDSTRKILDEYKENGALEWYSGDNLKPAKSFWDLVRNAPDSDYYCFCDQDDVWFEDKIARAITALQKENNKQPLLYCSNVIVTDASCKALYPLDDGTAKHTDFAHSLIYSLAPGCTMMFNAAARREFLKYDMNLEFEIIHDWLAHKIAAMFGKVVYDPQPSMYYRQHGNNVIGSQRTGRISGFFQKVKRIMGNYAGTRSLSAKSLISVYGSDASEENRHLLDIVANYKENKKLKKEFLKTKAFAIGKTSHLKWAVRLNKV